MMNDWDLYTVNLQHTVSFRRGKRRKLTFLQNNVLSYSKLSPCSREDSMLVGG